GIRYRNVTGVQTCALPISNTGGGYLKVSINGTQVVDYSGPLGYGVGTNWEYGIYRSTAPETVAVDYRNMTLVTGAAATASSSSRSEERRVGEGGRAPSGPA